MEAKEGALGKYDLLSSWESHNMTALLIHCTTETVALTLSAL